MADFQNSVRLASLHNQDMELQLRSQAQTDAHEKMQRDQADWDEAHGITWNPHPNDGDAVTQSLQAQTAANGSATIPPGTHLAHDGEIINLPSDDPNTQAGLLQKYKQLAGVIPGIPAFPGMDKADHVPAGNLDVMTHALGGYMPDGSPMKHEQLTALIPALQSQRDALAKNNATPYQLQTLDNLIGIYKANEKGHQDFEDAAAAKVAQQKGAQKAAEVAAENSPEAIAGAAKKAGAIANAELPAKKALQDNAAGNKSDTTNLDSVAYDPNYQNSDGTKGGNVVMSKTDASAKGLTHYKADPSTINTVVAGMNDVQTKLNQLADVANDPNRFGQVQPGIAAQMLAHGHGISLEFGGHGGGASGGIGVDTSLINEKIYQKAVNASNQATRDYVTAMVGAHEAITQLPRLQTFGKSNRMTEKQMEAAQNLLPQPGDGPMASQKMTSLQGMIDPLRKQVPHMPGAEQIPSWRERQQQQKQQAAPATPTLGSNLGQWISGLQPTK